MATHPLSFRKKQAKSLTLKKKAYSYSMCKVLIEVRSTHRYNWCYIYPNEFLGFQTPSSLALAYSQEASLADDSQALFGENSGMEWNQDLNPGGLGMELES